METENGAFSISWKKMETENGAFLISWKKWKTENGTFLISWKIGFVKNAPFFIATVKKSKLNVAFLAVEVLIFCKYCHFLSSV